MAGLGVFLLASALVCLLLVPLSSQQVVKLKGQFGLDFGGYGGRINERGVNPNSRTELQPQGFFLPRNKDIAAARWEQRSREVKGWRKQRQDVKSCLRVHNKLRALHNVPDLVWDDKLAAFAQSRSQDMATKNYFSHVPGTPYGENLAWTTDTSASCASLIKMWYNEYKLYDFNKPSFCPATGHFTQLVWKGSTRVGCAIATSQHGLYLTCNYDPPGNFLGAFEQNVPPKICSLNSRCDNNNKKKKNNNNNNKEWPIRAMSLYNDYYLPYSNVVVEPVFLGDYEHEYNGYNYYNYYNDYEDYEDPNDNELVRRRPSRPRPSGGFSKKQYEDLWLLCLSGRCRGPRG